AAADRDDERDPAEPIARHALGDEQSYGDPDRQRDRALEPVGVAVRPVPQVVQKDEHVAHSNEAQCGGREADREQSTRAHAATQSETVTGATAVATVASRSKRTVSASTS